MSGADEGADDALQVDLHGFVTKPVAERIGGLDDKAFVQVADAVAVDDRGAETLGDLQRLRGVGASQPDHLDGGALAQSQEARRLARGSSGIGHGRFLSKSSETVPAPCRLARRCGYPEPAEGGRFRVRPYLDERSRFACEEGNLPSKEHASLLCGGRRGPAAPRRVSGLEARDRRFRPQQNEGHPAGEGS